MNREPLDVYFLLDRSGSMEGSKWTQACDALSRILKQLSEGDRVQVTWYETSFADLASGPTPVESFRRDWPTGRLEQLGTAGGTELLPALEHVLGQVDNHSAARKPVVVLVTDGQVANEAAVTMALRNHPRLVVHTFGIDTTVNDALLTQMAQQQRGRCVLLRPDEDIAAAIGRLGHLLASPVVTDLQTPAGWETADGPLPDLYAGETATAVLRGAGALPRELTGRDPRGQPITLNLAPRLLASPAISLLWAKRRITFLEARRDFVPAITLAKEFNLICQGAAFVAWDEVEKVPVANDQIVQPSMEIAKDTVFSPGYFGMIGDQDDETLTAGSLSGRGFFEPPSRDRSTRPSLVNLLRQPDPTPTWAQEPMFDCAWGPEVVLLLTQWLASHAGLRLRLAEWRLRKLIAGVVGKAGANPEDQLREFVHRLDTLVGTVGPHHEALELIRQNAGWQSVETPEP